MRFSRLLARGPSSLALKQFSSGPVPDPTTEQRTRALIGMVESTTGTKILMKYFPAVLASGCRRGSRWQRSCYGNRAEFIVFGCFTNGSIEQRRRDVRGDGSSNAMYEFSSVVLHPADQGSHVSN
jgi:hypothetical protein